MKKKISVVLCALLVVAMMVSLTGCLDRVKILGVWKGDLDMTEFINESITEEDKSVAEYIKIEDFKITVVFEFNSDGTYSQKVDEEAFKKTAESFKEDMKEGMIKYFEAYLEEANVNMSVDELLAASNTDLDKMIAEEYDDDFFKDATDSMTNEGNYEVKGGKLFLSDGADHAVDEDVYDTYEIKGDTLTLLDTFGGDNDEELKQFYPMVFTKQ